jgi:nicotinamide-nucleotide amidase
MNKMRAEIIAVGTELLLGQIVNTNAQFLSQSCADIGVNVYFQTVVGDNIGRIREALAIAKQRADLIICTGGLGPTQDDLTKDVLADVLGQQLVMHQPSMDKIEELFQGRSTPMPASNARQALMLEHSNPLKNDTGLAVGVGLTQDNTHYILLPGPPKEMKPMFERYAIPWIQSRMTGVQPLYSRMLKFAGIGESILEERLIDLIKEQSDPSIAPYAKEGEVLIRLTTRSASSSEAEAKLLSVEQEIRSRVGDYLFADQDIPLEQAVLGLLERSGRTIAAAESCTGGLLSDMFTAIPGSSRAFKGGIVCYTNEIKHKLLNVPMELLEGLDAPGAVSAEAAANLASSIRQLTGSSIGVSITGVAGPAESEGKPVGTVFVGIADGANEPAVIPLKLSGNRETIKLRAARSALYQVWRLLK